MNSLGIGGRFVLPHILYWNTAVLLLSSLTMERARRNIFREIDGLEEWLGMGRPALRKHASLGGSHAAIRRAFSDGTDGGLETVERTGLCVRSVVDTGKLFLLCDHGPARSPPGSWITGACFSAYVVWAGSSVSSIVRSQ